MYKIFGVSSAEALKNIRNFLGLYDVVKIAAVIFYLYFFHFASLIPAVRQSIWLKFGTLAGS